MNITDVKREFNLKGEDKLDVIFELQKKLKNKYDLIELKKGLFVPSLPIDIDDCKTQTYLKDLFFRIITELVEASETMKNKPWKLSEVITDVDHLKEELSDALHFFIELCINLGINGDELFSLYFRKQEVNQWRIETNY